MISWTEICIRLALAALLGGLVGLERERKDWAAGLRTHMMVCVGSTLAMMVSIGGFDDVMGNEQVELDPSRVAAQVVSGIGFIGAGTILLLRQKVIRGLTTASGLWTVSAVGLATGGGMYFAALLTTAIVIIILWGLHPLERRLFKRYKHQTIKIVTTDQEKPFSVIQTLLDNEKADFANLSIEKSKDSSVIYIRFSHISRSDMAAMMDDLRKAPDVQEVYWRKNI